MNLLEKIQEKEGIPPDQMRLIFKGRDIDPNGSIQDYNLREGSTVHLILTLRGAKPVIYLDAPEGTELSATVKLSLIPVWEFSAIYPIVPVQENKGQTVEWSVTTKHDGTLHEHNANVDVAYLFWEATCVVLSDWRLVPLTLCGAL